MMLGDTPDIGYPQERQPFRSIQSPNSQAILMRTTLLVLILTCLLAPISGSFPAIRGRTVSHFALEAGLKKRWLELNSLASKLGNDRKYSEVLHLLQPEAEEYAERFSGHPYAARTLAYLGGAMQGLFRFREALRYGLRARDGALEAGDQERAAMISHNLSNLYFHLQAHQQSLEAANDSVEALAAANNHQALSMAYLHKARLVARLGDLPSAIPFFRQGIEVADRGAATPLQAAGLELLGNELMRVGRLSEAEDAIVDAFRLRKTSRDPSITTTYQYLAMLHYKQGKHDSALALMETAMGLRDRSPRLPRWNLYYYRAQIQFAKGDLHGALNDLRIAIAQFHDARMHLAASEALRVSNTVAMQEVYSLFVDVATELYRRRRDPALVAESLWAAESNRAYSLRESSGETDRWQQHVPPNYAETLAQLHAAYAAIYRASSEQQRRRIQELRLRLSEMEAAAGASSVSLPAQAMPRDPAQWVRQLQSRLQPSDTLLVFHLGQDQSFLWRVGRNLLELHPLPSRESLIEEVDRFRQAVAADLPSQVSAGEVLYANLFGSLKGLNAHGDWILVPDGPLYGLPFSALVTRRHMGKPVYLAESGAVHLIPGLWALEQSSPDDSGWTGPPVAVGDPVYNRADPRWKPDSSSGLLRPLRSLADLFSRHVDARELSRLPGTEQEIAACSRSWQAAGNIPGPVLRGADANPETIASALQLRPSLMHFATHLIPSPENPSATLLALSLDPAAQPSFLGQEWIASRNVKASLVMMSGCHSGGAEVKPGEGLMGLTRAWLLAGARTVAATLWAIPDDAALTPTFYRYWFDLNHLPARRRAARALQSSQLDMIRSTTFRSRPKYWASYFVVGRS